MALSNIFREPKRELIESAIGICLFACGLWVDYHFACWFHDATSGVQGGCPVPLGMVIGIILLAVTWLALLFTHFIGELICDSLALRGLELRPKNRR